MRRIVVLDDDQVILELLETVLADSGHGAVVAPSLDALPAGTEADLVLADLVTLNGYSRQAAVDWVASLRVRFPGAALMVVTAHRPALAEPDKLGADAVVAKPFDVELLLAQIDQLLS